MQITTSAFEKGGTIPARFSRDGEDHSPPLTFSDVPQHTRSLVLIMDDPDAPSGLFTHWVVFDIPPEAGGLPENAVPTGAGQGKNDWGEAGYGGPRPPRGEHRYFFRLHALDAKLDLPAGVARAKVETAMQSHVLARAELMGRFSAPTS